MTGGRHIEIYIFLTPPATAEHSVAAALRIWFTRRDFFIFFLLDFRGKFLTDQSEIWPQCVNPEGLDNREFHRDSFCSF